MAPPDRSREDERGDQAEPQGEGRGRYVTVSLRCQTASRGCRQSSCRRCSPAVLQSLCVLSPSVSVRSSRSARPSSHSVLRCLAAPLEKSRSSALPGSSLRPSLRRPGGCRAHTPPSSSKPHSLVCTLSDGRRPGGRHHRSPRAALPALLALRPGLPFSLQSLLRSFRAPFRPRPFWGWDWVLRLHGGSSLVNLKVPRCWLRRRHRFRLSAPRVTHRICLGGSAGRLGSTCRHRLATLTPLRRVSAPLTAGRCQRVSHDTSCRADLCQRVPTAPIGMPLYRGSTAVIRRARLLRRPFGPLMVQSPGS